MNIKYVQILIRPAIRLCIDHGQSATVAAVDSTHHLLRRQHLCMTTTQSSKRRASFFSQWRCYW